MSNDPVTARFPAQRASVSAARQFVTDCLIEAGATSVLDEARLLISELATNAIVHAKTEFSVSVHVSAGRVYVEVRDGDPRMIDLDDDVIHLDEPGGHGLRIVGRLAGDWGTRIEEHGKVVWFSVDA